METNPKRYDLGQKIKAARKSKKMTQATVAAMLGVQETAISKFETGEEGGLPLLLALLELYNLEITFTPKTNDADSPRIIERKKKS